MGCCGGIIAVIAGLVTILITGNILAGIFAAIIIVAFLMKEE